MLIELGKTIQKELPEYIQGDLGIVNSYSLSFLLEYSMGMSGDYEKAIEEGSTNIRVGMLSLSLSSTLCRVHHLWCQRLFQKINSFPFVLCRFVSNKTIWKKNNNFFKLIRLVQLDLAFITKDANKILLRTNTHA